MLVQSRSGHHACRGRLRGGSAQTLTAALSLLAALGCSTRPVPHLDRELIVLETLYRTALGTEDPVEQVREQLETRRSTAAFLARLDGEQVLLPHASAHGSTRTNSGGAMLRLEKRDVAAVRSRTEVLLHRIDRFLATTARERLAGSGYAIAEGRLVPE